MVKIRPQRGVSILEILISVAVISLIFPPVLELLFNFVRPTSFQNNSQTIFNQIFDHESVNKKYTCDNLFDSLEGATDSVSPKSITLKIRAELGLATSSSSVVTGVSIQNQNIFITANSSSTTEPDIYNITTRQYTDTGPGITVLKQFGPYFIAANSGVKNQIQIIRKNDLSVYKTFIIPGSNSTTNPITKSFTVARGLLFIGTEKSVLPEIFIFDIFSGQVISSIETGYGVNDLYVLGNLLFIASPRDPEVEVFDISYLGNPQKVATYDAPGGSGNGKTFDIQNQKLLLGRTRGGNELLALNLIQNSSGSTSNNALNPISSIELYAEQKIGWSIDRIAAFRDSLANTYLLLLTNDSQKELQIYKYRADHGPEGYNLIYSYNLPSRATDFACSKKALYVSIENLDTPLVEFEF